MHTLRIVLYSVSYTHCLDPLRPPPPQPFPPLKLHTRVTLQQTGVVFFFDHLQYDFGCHIGLNNPSVIILFNISSEL